MKILGMSLPVQILLGLVLGIIFGIFFGEMMRVVEPIGEIFIMLLKMAILPYIMFALIFGMGSLEIGQAKRLLKYGIIFLVVIWIIVMATMFLLEATFPAIAAPIPSFGPPNPAAGAKGSFLRYFIPANPFNALANNIVPAVVVFSIIFGVALMFIKTRENILGALDTVVQVLGKIIKWVVAVSPIGVFALISSTVGSLSVNQLQKLEIYIVDFILATLFLTFVALPLLATSLTKVTYRQIFKELGTCILLAFATGNIFVSVPYMIAGLERLFGGDHPDNESRKLARTVVPIAYTLPLVGNLMAFFFILFFAFYSSIPLTVWDNARLAFASLFALAGPVTAGLNSISFLVDAFHLPPEGIRLFAETSAITRNLQALAGSMGIAVFTYLTVSAFAKRLHWYSLRLIAATTGLLVTFVAMGVVAFYISPAPQPVKPVWLFLTLDKTAKATVYRKGDVIPKATPFKEGESHLGRIEREKVIRIGYNPNALPFSYFNEKDELVGYDIAYAYNLATTLGVDIEFIPMGYEALISMVDGGDVDIAVSAVTVSPERLRELSFSRPTAEVDLVFVVRDSNRFEFSNLEKVKNWEGLRIGALRGSAQETVARQLFPKATIVPLDDIDEILHTENVDTVIWSNLEALAWCMMNPTFTLTTVQPTARKEVFAFAMHLDSLELRNHVNYWLDLRQADGFEAEQRAKWLHAHQLEPPRHWSIIKNVLHWVN